MSLLTKLLVLVGIGCLGLWGYFYLQSTTEKEIITEKRYLSLLTNSLSDPSGTLDNLDELLGSSKITNNELLLLAELILDSPEKSIDPYLPKLSEKLNDPSVDWQVLSAVVEYHEGRIAEALTKLQKLVEENPANRRASYEYNRARMSAGSVEARIPAKLKLFDLAKSEDRWAYKSLRVLTYSSPVCGLTQRDVERASKELRTHALVQPADFLTASGILLSLQESNQIEAFLQETQELGNDLVSVGEFGSWLGQIGRPDLVLQVVSSQNALADDPAFFARFRPCWKAIKQSRRISYLGRQATYLNPGFCSHRLT
jgi:tetratricopeptide (TPR) repeat protein